MPKPITSRQVAVICATKDRPEKVASLLKSVAGLTVKPGQVLIADGGHNLRSLVTKFQPRLPVECLYCPEPGQVLQRMYGHRHLRDEIRLVLHLDDDITLVPDSLELALENWNNLANQHGKPLAGMAFNVANLPDKKDNIIRKFALMRVEPKGRVWPSGYISPHVPVVEGMGRNFETEWLVGGAALWDRAVLATPHPMSFPTRWAFCEDVIFSYPFSKTHRLVACANAVAMHNDTYTNHKFSKSVFYGKSQVILRHFLVAANPSLSKMAFFWATSLHIFGYMAVALTGNINALGTGLGMIKGLRTILSGRLLKKSYIDLARELGE